MSEPTLNQLLFQVCNTGLPLFAALLPALMGWALSSCFSRDCSVTVTARALLIGYRLCACLLLRKLLLQGLQLILFLLQLSPQAPHLVLVVPVELCLNATRV